MTIRIALLGSTNGTHLKHLHNAHNNGELNGQIGLVISDRFHAPILQKAHDRALPYAHVPKDQFSDKLMHKLLIEHNIDYVYLTGYLRKISPWLCHQWQGRIFNIHPSLLPDYQGLIGADIHSKVLQNGDKVTGCTLHHVNETIDGGETIKQQSLTVDSSDTIETLAAKVQELEIAIIIEHINELAAQYEQN